MSLYVRHASLHVQRLKSKVEGWNLEARPLVSGLRLHDILQHLRVEQYTNPTKVTEQQ